MSMVGWNLGARIGLWLVPTSLKNAVAPSIIIPASKISLSNKILLVSCKTGVNCKINFNLPNCGLLSQRVNAKSTRIKMAKYSLAIVNFQILSPFLDGCRC